MSTKFPMDLSRFKKISSDEKTTTLAHPAGHSFKIAHSALSPKMQAQLKAIPHFDDGGQVSKAEAAKSSMAAWADPSSVSKAYHPGANVSGMGGGSKPATSMETTHGPDDQSVNTEDAAEAGAKETADNWQAAHPGQTNPYAHAKGGQIKDPKRMADGDSPEDVSSAMVKLAPLLMAMARGGQVPRQKMADGGFPLPNQGMSDEQAVAQNPGPVADVGNNPSAPQQPLDIEPIAQDDAQQPQAAAPQPSQGLAPQPSAPDQDAAQDQTSEDSAPADPRDGSPSQALIQGANAYEAQNPLAQTGVSLQDLKAAHQNQYQQDDQEWAHDLANQHITPETYSDLFAKKSTLGKIGTIFGLLASGIGSGLTHQPNALLGMMNNEIQNDLEAQKQSKGNAQNYLRLGQQHEEIKARNANLNQDTATKAYALGNMRMNRAALQSMTSKVQALPVGSPQRQNAEAALALMSQSVNNENYAIGDRAASQEALMNYAGGQGQAQSPEQAFQAKNRLLMMSGNSELAKDQAAKHFPGIPGQASEPLSPSDRDQLNSGITFQNQLQRFTDWTKNHSGSLSPSDINEGRAMSNGLSNAYRAAIGGGVYKEGEQGFIGQSIDPDPTKFFNNIRVLPKLKAVQRDSAAQLDQLAKSKGFQGYQNSGPQLSSQQQGFYDFAKKNPNDPRSAMILKKLGVQ